MTCNQNPACCKTENSGFFNGNGEQKCATKFVHCVQACNRGQSYTCQNVGSDACTP
jgi:hypothetical protein